jgi:hypothetical protein
VPGNQLFEGGHIASLRRFHQRLIICRGMIYFSHRFDGGRSATIQPALEFPFGGWQAAGNAWIPLAGKIYRLGKGLE